MWSIFRRRKPPESQRQSEVRPTLICSTISERFILYWTGQKLISLVSFISEGFVTLGSKHRVWFHPSGSIAVRKNQCTSSLVVGPTDAKPSLPRDRMCKPGVQIVGKIKAQWFLLLMWKTNDLRLYDIKSNYSNEEERICPTSLGRGKMEQYIYVFKIWACKRLSERGEWTHARPAGSAWAWVWVLGLGSEDFFWDQFNLTFLTF